MSYELQFPSEKQKANQTHQNHKSQTVSKVDTEQTPH